MPEYDVVSAALDALDEPTVAVEILHRGETTTETLTPGESTQARSETMAVDVEF